MNKLGGIAAVLALAACSSTTDGARVIDSLLQQQSSIDHATIAGITTASSLQQAPSISGLATDGAAQGIFGETLALEPPPTGAWSCPDDAWARYVVVFYSGSETTAAVTLDPIGCELVDVSSADGDVTLTAARDGGTYWNDLAAGFQLAAGTVGPTAVQPPTQP